MSSFNRRSFILSAVAAPVLAGCGFEPVYGPTGGARALLNNIKVDDPTDSPTYILVRELEDRLGRGDDSADYGLSFSLTTERKSVGKTVAQVTSRYDILGDVTFALRDLTTNQVITSGKVNSFAGYSATGSTVSELAAETDAYERLMVLLTDRIVAQLQAYATANPL